MDQLALNKKVAVVTGGAGGIGRGIARCFSAAGAAVVVADIDEPGGREIVDALVAEGGRASLLTCDLTDDATPDLLVRHCVEEFGALDILVNDAGVYPSALFLETTTAHFDRIFGLNVRALYFCAQAAARQMVAAGSGGVIINIASVDGLHPSRPGLSAYGASKAAVLELTQNMALELAPHQIRVLALSPGPVPNERDPNRLADPVRWAAIGEMMAERVPLRRMGTADDIGAVALFLASSAAGYMTGSNVLVDGGLLLD